MAEIHRVLADGGAGFVVYTRASAPLFRFTERLRARRSGKAVVSDRPELPYTPLDCAEFQRISGEHMDLQLRTWAVLENDVTRVAIPDNVLGKAVLLLVSWAESAAPAPPPAASQVPHVRHQEEPAGTSAPASVRVAAWLELGGWWAVAPASVRVAARLRSRRWVAVVDGLEAGRWLKPDLSGGSTVKRALPTAAGGRCEARGLRRRHSLSEIVHSG